FASHNPLLNAEETRELWMMRRRNDEQIVHIKSFSRPKIHSNDEDLQEYGIDPKAFFKIN
ncbi:hypothetical protein, partial [Escherichia coli]|uniref:hypothetical protein n=1 Tax=Escherichia coli TaxID=562 RepID=UPI003B803347